MVVGVPIKVRGTRLDRGGSFVGQERLAVVRRRNASFRHPQGNRFAWLGFVHKRSRRQRRPKGSFIGCEQRQGQNARCEPCRFAA